MMMMIREESIPGFDFGSQRPATTHLRHLGSAIVGSDQRFAEKAIFVRANDGGDERPDDAGGAVLPRRIDHAVQSGSVEKWPRRVVNYDQIIENIGRR